MKSLRLLFALSLLCSTATFASAQHALVIQTDFGTKDGAVAAMKGIAFGVSPKLPIFDLSQDNTPYDIWEGAYRLKQTAAFWPEGTVFISVIDPGVGTERASVVLKTKSGHYFVGPDNGTWTLVAEELGVAAVRRIDEKTNRRAGSEKSYTFHGRDIYAFVGARLAAGVITYEQVGPLLEPKVISLPYQKPARDGAALVGTIPLIDFHYGNVWSNIPDTLFEGLSPAPQFGDKFTVIIFHDGREKYRGVIPYVRTFGDVKEGEPLLYLNSLLNVAFALNMGSFSEKHGLASGGDWTVRIERVK
ncbi:acetolactate synthase [Oleiharenicola lentus]|jgi:S-adenosylmethionine hydrolase|uniref:Acetolactate synthase n=1 Tax=Oleiharenicola lentus TaxID=2508720 RepID=A0A4Q1C9E8_9BACT|nr:S-adenosyl-l-methionine hydroxide adenosyltransferase family protein [Oleiharenicola lentus]RXK55615.1 acetolactate synthase [Oleiharenicola lentus]